MSLLLSKDFLERFVMFHRFEDILKPVEGANGFVEKFSNFYGANFYIR